MLYVVTRGNHYFIVQVFFKKLKNSPAALPTNVSSLKVNELQAANSSVQKISEQKSASDRSGKCNNYTAEERAMIGLSH